MTIITHIMTLATHKTQGPHISIHYQKLISQPLDMYSSLFCKRAQGVTCSITRLTSTPHHSTNSFFAKVRIVRIGSFLDGATDLVRVALFRYGNFLAGAIDL